ncbi:MAG: hypothetical protein IJF10_05580, partial [Clostridia bacterium]|nr:hypothetical protein [Clostridia bacterium]
CAFGTVGKHHITASICEQHHYAQHNITFALAKTSPFFRKAFLFARNVCLLLTRRARFCIMFEKSKENAP